MDSAHDSISNRRHLDLEKRLNERRRELRIKWTEVARRAGMTPENLRRIRRGQISISEDAADGIDDALQWQRGSVQFILEGRDPIPVNRPEVDPEARFAELEQRFAVAETLPKAEQPAALDQLIAELEALKAELLHDMERERRSRRSAG